MNTLNEQAYLETLDKEILFHRNTLNLALDKEDIISLQAFIDGIDRARALYELELDRAAANKDT